MKTKTKENLIFVSIYSLLVFSALGAMAGTYAWYEYRSRASTQFYGTAVNRSGDLRIGLHTVIDLPDAENYGLIKEGNNYWAEEGLSSDALTYFLSASGYASTSLYPVSSGSYVENGAFSLRSNPEYLANNTYRVPEQSHYIKLPLVFALGENGSDSPFAVRLKDAKIKSTSRLKEAIRIHFDVGTSNYTFAPNADRDGEDIVGGVLDLNRDGFIDYNLSTKKEFVYGESETVSHKSQANAGETPLEWEDRNCFNGVHDEGTYSVNDDVVYKTAQYRGKNSFLSSVNVSTSDSRNNAYANLTIYAEGWAGGLIDQVEGTDFNLDLTFEVSK